LSLHKMQMVCEKHPEDVYIEYLAWILLFMKK
jgi:hypothetical protein